MAMAAWPPDPRNGQPSSRTLTFTHITDRTQSSLRSTVCPVE
jgi:hypothetical protein